MKTTRRALGVLFAAVGCVLGLIAAQWGRNGFYASEAPLLVVLALAALVCLGIGAAMLRYDKPGSDSGADARASIAERAFATPAGPAAAPAPAAPSPADRGASMTVTDTIDEATRERPSRTTAGWLLLLPDGSSLPITDALVIGRQPVAFDDGLTAAVPSPEASRSHARFSIVGRQLRVRDLDSTNGTIVVHPDGAEVRASSASETALQHGDRLEIGTYVLRVEHRA